MIIILDIVLQIYKNHQINCFCNVIYLYFFELARSIKNNANEHLLQEEYAVYCTSLYMKVGYRSSAFIDWRASYTLTDLCASEAHSSANERAEGRRL